MDTTKPLRILGLMTGSSADGLDVCLVSFKGNTPFPSFEINHSREIPYPIKFKTAFSSPLNLSYSEVANLSEELGVWLAEEISKLNLMFDMIASHGQTIKHEPPFYTQQIGNPKYMAQKFKVPVIYDFRTADIKQGGQGAPLIPIVDQLLFGQKQEDILALNIGGISNLTVLPSFSNNSPLLAWDTGPGNTLIDKAIKLYSNESLAFDEGGAVAAQGTPNMDLLAKLLTHHFYTQPFPKSAGQEQFGKTYFNDIVAEFKPNIKTDYKDLISTLTLLTAKTIARAIQQLPHSYKPRVMYVSGGGFRNKTLMRFLNEELPGIQLQQVELKGITTDNKEAFGFAYLGYLNHHRLCGNIPSVTGAKQKVVLGKTHLNISY